MLTKVRDGLLALLTGVVFAIAPVTMAAAGGLEIDELFDLEELIEEELEEELEEEFEEELEELEEEFEEEEEEDDD